MDDDKWTPEPALRGTIERLRHLPVPELRQSNLRQLASQVERVLHERKGADIVFVCSHNSRRSLMSQVWATAAAAVYQMPIRAFSAGSEATSVSNAALSALARQGFRIKGETVSFGPGVAPLRVWSKGLGDPSLPRDGFVAIVNCSQAEEACPVVQGSVTRLALLYKDPRAADGTSDEERAYDACATAIGCEMLALMAAIRGIVESRSSSPAPS